MSQPMAHLHDSASFRPLLSVSYRHTRSCDGALVCSCVIKAEKAYFKRSFLAQMRRKRIHSSISRSIKRQSDDINVFSRPLTRLCSPLRKYIASFLEAKDLARLVTVRSNDRYSFSYLSFIAIGLLCFEFGRRELREMESTVISPSSYDYRH